MVMDTIVELLKKTLLKNKNTSLSHYSFGEKIKNKKKNLSI